MTDSPANSRPRARRDNAAVGRSRDAQPRSSRTPDPTPTQGHGRAGQRGQRRRDEPKVALSVDQAGELLDLLEDATGEADEDLLDGVLAALNDPHKLTAAELDERQDGHIITLRVDRRETAAIGELITNWDATGDEGVHRRVANRLGELMRAAERRRTNDT